MSDDSRKAALLEQAKAHLFRSSKDYGEPVIEHGRGAAWLECGNRTTPAVI